MTKLYSSDFESAAVASKGTNPDWPSLQGNGLAIVDVPAASLGTEMAPVSGTKVIGERTNGESSYYSAAGVLGDQAMRTATYLHTATAADHRWLAHVLRSGGAANPAKRYVFYVGLSASGTLTVDIQRYENANIWYRAGTISLPVVAGDLIHFETRATGTTTTTLEARIWKNSDPRPSTPSNSTTDSSSPLVSGYPGLQIQSPGLSSWAYTDNVVITDAAGGEDFFYPPGATVNLVGASCTQGATSSTGAVNVTPPVAGVVNLAGSNCTQAATSSTGAVTVTQAVGTITTESYRNAAIPGQALASLTIPHVVALRMDRSVALSLANQVTDAAGVLTIANAALARGTDYMLASFNADGTLCGIKKYTAT